MRQIRQSDITEQVVETISARFATNADNRSPQSVSSYTRAGVQFARECVAEIARREGGVVYVTQDGSKTVFDAVGNHDGKVW